MKPNVIFAIFKRNFLSYFASPTGYVFICVFVVACSWAAFWPDNFFDLNLANLDQLNSKIPLILLMFIPAISMSIWAEERRQGTDELLLTIPAGDLDVVLGKYLAATAIFSVSLSFSLLCNYFVLAALAWPEGPDPGLFVATYFGYWLMGLAMLAVGMAASFFTNNLTVAFILGVLLNVPLVFLNYFDVVLPTDNVNRWLGTNLTWLTNKAPALADTLVPSDLGERIKGWSLESQFLDFGRGMLSLGALAYFAMIVAVMLYLCMVLIGRRHWQGARAGASYGFHYLSRFLSLALLAWGLIVIFHRFDLRQDITKEQIASLSPASRALVKELKRPVRIEAYISPNVPESYVQARLNLISALKEIKAAGQKNIVLHIHDTDPLSVQAEQAEQQFGITAQAIESHDRGVQKIENIYLGVAVVSGLEKVVIPFIGRELPVEYELTRSIATVDKDERKKLGILATDVRLMGGQDEMLVNELKKQYEVVQVSADSPIVEKCDVLLAVQPSSLSPEQMENFITCVKQGQPTAIFEDPFPQFFPGVPGTNVPKQGPIHPQFGMPMGPGAPKGNIQPLWSLLGVQFSADHVVWQDHNPYPKLQGIFPMEFVMLDQKASTDPMHPVFDKEDQISSGLKEMLFPFPGYITFPGVSDVTARELVRTGPDTGTELATEIFVPNPRFPGRRMLNPNLRHIRGSKTYYVLAAHIQGSTKSPKSMSDAEPDVASSKTSKEDKKTDAATTADKQDAEAKSAAKQDSAADKAKSDEDKSKPADKDTKKKEGDKKSAEPQLNVVLVADIDVLTGAFLQIRSMGIDEDAFENFHPDNVTFVLNALDVLAGDERFVEVRNRRREHRTLKQIEERTADAREKADKQREKFINQFKDEIAKEQKNLNDQVAKIEKRTDIDQMQKNQEKTQVMVVLNQRLEVKQKELERSRDKELQRIDRELVLSKRAVQDWYKMWAVLLPPLFPMMIGVAVFFNRRANEREGVSRARLRKGVEG